MSAKKSEYLKHQLNKSPSKASYTFSKSERFPDPASTHEAKYSKKKQKDMKSPAKSPSRYNVISRGSSRKQSFTENEDTNLPRQRKSSQKRGSSRSIPKNEEETIKKPTLMFLNPDQISDDNRSYSNTHKNSLSRRTSRDGSRLQAPSQASSRSGRLRSNPKSPGYSFATSPRRTADKFVRKDNVKNGPGAYKEFSQFGGNA